MSKPTLQQIQGAIQNQGAKWTPGVTSVSELSEDQQNLRLGLDIPKGERGRVKLALAQEQPPSLFLLENGTGAIKMVRIG